MKKFLSGLFILLGLFGFSSSFGAYEVGLPYYVGSYSTTVKPYGNFLTSWIGSDKKVFALDPKNFFFWNGTGLYEMLYSDRLGLEHWEGYLPYFFLCSNFSSGATSWQDVGMCDQQYSISQNFDILSTYMSTVNSDNYFIAGYDFNNYLGIYFCVNTDLDKSVCFDGYNRYLANDSGWPKNELNLGDITFYDISSSYLGNSPFSQWGGGSNFTGSGVGGITYTLNTDYEKTLSYYEDRFGWNKSMCYVGTNDLTSPYGTSGISFDNGTGGTIYSLFYSIYSGYGDNRIQNVGRFINTWLINYSQWFETVPSNRLFLASYSGPGNNVEYIYTGFTFPFANNPLAVYFMASNLQTNYSREATQGEEMAYYCYLKLNEQVTNTGSNLGGDLSFDQVQDLINPNIVGRIDTYNNEVIGTGKVGFLVPNMSGSVWGDVVSGNVFSGDVDPSNIFDTFYDGIFSLVGNGNFSDGIIPLWIIYPMLFLILFRIMKH